MLLEDRRSLLHEWRYNAAWRPVVDALLTLLEDKPATCRVHGMDQVYRCMQQYGQETTDVWKVEPLGESRYLVTIWRDLSQFSDREDHFIVTVVPATMPLLVDIEPDGEAEPVEGTFPLSAEDPGAWERPTSRYIRVDEYNEAQRHLDVATFAWWKYGQVSINEFGGDVGRDCRALLATINATRTRFNLAPIPLPEELEPIPED